MRNLQGKVPEKRVRPSMALLVIAVVGTAILSIGAITTTAAYAQALGNGGHGTPRTDTGQPTDPNCWGEINSGLAQASGGVGQHASDPTPGDDTPRLGVGNQPEGHPSDHADTVGPLFGQDLCENPN